MSDVVVAGIIGAGAAILSSTLTGYISYLIALRGEDVRHLRKKLKTAYEDIAAFYELEKRYSETLASYDYQGKSAEAVRRSFRESLREDGYQSPSRSSTPSYIAEQLQKLAD
jgi:hypothetical protein